MWFKGSLVTEKALERVATRRGKNYLQKSISKSELDSYLAEGWQVKYESKYRSTVHKSKEPDELFEDTVWKLFKDMSFQEMNDDRNFEIKIGQDYQQVDVFARDGNNIFIVECKSSKNNKVITKSEISAISDLKKDICTSIKQHYQEKSLRISFLLATQGRQWIAEREEMAKKRQILVCQDNDISYLSELIEHLGSSARYQFYSLMFRDKKAASHNWWKFDLAISYTLLSSKSIPLSN